MKIMKLFLKNIVSEKYIVIFLWSLGILSIGAKFDIENFYVSNFEDLINLIRGSYLLIFLPAITFFLYIFNLVKPDISKIKNYLIFYLIFIFLLMLSGYLNFKINNPELFELTKTVQDLRFTKEANAYTPKFFYSISFPLKLIILSTFFFLFVKDYFFKNLVYTTFIIISLTTVYFLFLIYGDYFAFREHDIFYYSNTINFEETLGNSNPRITSISRMLCVILIFLSYKILTIKNKNYLFLFIFLIYLIFFNIFLLQSRPSLYFSIFIILYIFFKKFDFYKSILITLILYFSIIPSEYLLKKIKLNLLESKIITESNEDRFNEELDGFQKDIYTDQNFELTDFLKFNLRKNNKWKEDDTNIEKINTYSTGRLNIWKQIVNHNKSSTANLIIGFGPMSDRYLVKENASSSFMYMLISTGLLGLISYLLLLVSIGVKIINIILKNNFKNYFLNSMLLLMIFLTLRSLVENSFTIIGLDFYLFLIAFYCLHNHQKIAQNMN